MQKSMKWNPIISFAAVVSSFSIKTKIYLDKDFAALKRYCVTMILSVISLSVVAQKEYVCKENKTTLYDSTGKSTEHPKPFSFITNVPKDIIQISVSSFGKRNFKNIGLIIATSTVLILADKKIYNAVRKFSDNINLHPEEENKTLWSIKTGNKETVLLKVPKNLNTGLYNIGQGYVTMLIAAGFYVQGKISKNYTSLQTASDLTESFITLGLTTQLLKYATGRENPGINGDNWNAWHPFPSLSSFQNNKSRYDAFPSGHLSTLMAAVTILANNYPNRKWIKPVGYTLVALCGFSMINNSVHWAGDYPLAIGLGYLTGTIITSRHKQKIKKSIPEF